MNHEILVTKGEILVVREGILRVKSEILVVEDAILAADEEILSMGRENLVIEHVDFDAGCVDARRKAVPFALDGWAETV